MGRMMTQEVTGHLAQGSAIDLIPERAMIEEGMNPMNSKKTILFAEPDRECRKTIREMLEKSGYAVVTANEGREALSILATNTVDLIISALRMPNVGGLELLGEVQRTKLRVPVIFLTGYGDVESYMDLMNMGAFDYLNKPAREEEILRVTRSALEDDGAASRLFESLSA